MFYISDQSRFIKDRQEALRGYFKLIQNPTPAELRQGIYKPRLTLTPRFNATGKFQKTLSIEFSIPKLIFGNNFDELTGNEFSQIIEKLNTLLLEMGVKARPSCLNQAPVSSVHYSKNIPLTDYTTPFIYIQQFGKANFNAIIDTCKTDYFNGGSGIKTHTNNYEIALYDKLLDLIRSKISDKRAEEKNNALQLNLLDLINPKKPFEVIRLEIRLNTRQKIRQLLRLTNTETEPTFINLFNQEISKKVLLYHIQVIENALPPLLAYQNSPSKLFSSLQVSNPGTKLKHLKNLLTMCGLKSIIDDAGIRGFRQLTKSYGKTVWYSLNKEMKQLKTADEPSIFNLLKKEITAFKPLKLLDFQDNMLNNDKYN